MTHDGFGGSQADHRAKKSASDGDLSQCHHALTHGGGLGDVRPSYRQVCSGILEKELRLKGVTVRTLGNTTTSAGSIQQTNLRILSKGTAQLV